MLPHESLTARALRSILWILSSMGVVAFLRLINLMILARLLGPNTFGLMSAALVVVGLSNVIADMGVGYALIQRRTVSEREFRTGLSVSLATGLILYALVWVVSEPVGQFFKQERLAEVLCVLGVVFPLRSISVPADAILQRELAFSVIARIDVIAYVVGYFGVSVGLAVIGFEIWALGGGFLGEAAVRTALLAWRSPFRLRPGFDPVALRELLRFGTGVSLTRIANFVALQADKIVVGRTLGTLVLGSYERAYQLMVMPANLLGQVVGRVLFPVLSRVQGNADALRNGYRRSLALTALVTLPLSVVIVLLDRELVRFILGSGWDDAVPAFQILGSVLLFRASYKISGELARACGAIYADAWRQVAYAAAVLAGGLAGARWGLAGVSTGVAAAITFNFILMTDLGRRLTNLSWGDVLRAHRPAGLLAVVSGLACLAAESLARRWGLGDTSTVLVATAAAGLAGAGLMLRWPRLLGEDGLWLVEVLRDHAPVPVRRLLQRLLPRTAPATEDGT